MNNKKHFTIDRTDGLGNQITNRFFAERWAERSGVKYHHTKMTNVAHLTPIDTDVQEALDYIYHWITGKSNKTAQLSENIEITKLEKICSSGYGTFLNFRDGGKEPFNEVAIFTRDEFVDLATSFHERNKDFNIHRPTGINIVIHIRCGDYITTNDIRLKDIKYYKNISEQLKQLAAKSSCQLNFIIETDSPKIVQSLASDLNAHVNPVSSAAEKLKQEQIAGSCDKAVKMWDKAVNTMQAIYNMATADIFVASESGFSNLGFLLSLGKGLVPETNFLRYQLAALNSKHLLEYQKRKPTLNHWLSKWGNEPPEKMKAEQFGVIYRIYNYFFAESESVGDGTCSSEVERIFNLIT